MSSLALGFSRRRAFWVVLAFLVGLAILIGLVRGCKGGQRLAGEAKEYVHSMEEIPIEDILELPELAEYLSSAEPASNPGDFINMSCGQIIAEEVQHLIYAEDPDCSSVVLANALGFDLVISYTDAACRWEPTFIVGVTDNLLHFTIDRSKDRGGCDDMKLFFAKGIQLKDKAALELGKVSS